MPASPGVVADRPNRGHKERAWAQCDIETKACDIRDVRIGRFNRSEEVDFQELSVDIISEAREPRFIRLWVSYQSRSGRDKSGCGVAFECGYSKIVRAD